jgi:predicted protein tyrosine phosphatase
MTFVVCPLSRLEDVIARRRPSHVLTLLGSERMIGAHAAMPADRHLRVLMDDIEHPAAGMTAPTAAMVERILAFAEGWEGVSPMVVHCFAGVSRSTAAAFTLACARNPGADEGAIARALRAAAPHAQPNRRIVALADDILDRRGRMLEAVAEIGPGDFVGEGVPFDLAARH